MIPVLVLRPEPGASVTAARARALGLAPLVAPLFVIEPIAWTPPDPARFDGVMLTSANALRQAGASLARYTTLPVYAVGAATAAAARAAGFGAVHAGPADAAALLDLMAAAGVGHALHLCGVDHHAARHPAVAITRLPVYRAVAIDALPSAWREAMASGAVALVHSPRAAATFASLVDAAGIDRAAVSIAAISPAAAAAAGAGWRRVAVAATCDDAALLAEAARLCDGGG